MLHGRKLHDIRNFASVRDTSGVDSVMVDERDGLCAMDLERYDHSSYKRVFDNRVINGIKVVVCAK